jgi:hypothetical protein
MNKYLSIHDIDDTTAHVFQLPSNFMVHVKTCTDGIALAVLSSEGKFLYGLSIPCDKRHYPILKEIASTTTGVRVEEMLLGNVMNALHEFINSDDTLFVFEQHICKWISQLDNALSEIEGIMPAATVGRKNFRRHRNNKKNYCAN